MKIHFENAAGTGTACGCAYHTVSAEYGEGDETITADTTGIEVTCEACKAALVLPTVSCYISEIDGALVIEVDGRAPAMCRVFMNDNEIANVDNLDQPPAALFVHALTTSQNRVTP